jgi:hypothetical protein
MDEAAGQALLDEIYEAGTRPEFVYCHEWQVGEAVDGRYGLVKPVSVNCMFLYFIILWIPSEHVITSTLTGLHPMVTDVAIGSRRK